MTRATCSLPLHQVIAGDEGCRQWDVWAHAYADGSLMTTADERCVLVDTLVPLSHVAFGLPARAPRPRWLAGSRRSGATARRPCSAAHTAGELPSARTAAAVPRVPRGPGAPPAPTASAACCTGLLVPRRLAAVRTLCEAPSIRRRVLVTRDRCGRGPTKPRAGCRPAAIEDVHETRAARTQRVMRSRRAQEPAVRPSAAQHARDAA